MISCRSPIGLAYGLVGGCVEEQGVGVLGVVWAVCWAGAARASLQAGGISERGELCALTGAGRLFGAVPGLH